MAAPYHLCAVCTRPGKACVGCDNIHYCGKACQKTDWSLHRSVCGTFEAFSDNKRQTLQSKRAIYLPIDGANPKFVWINVEHDSTKNVDHTNVGALLEEDEALLGYHQISCNPVLDRSLDHSVMIAYRDNPDLALNQSIRNITGGTSIHPWKGPVVAYGMKELDDCPTTCDDLDTTDLKSITDWLLIYFVPEKIDPNGQWKPNTAKMTQAVKINCEGSVTRFQKPFFEQARLGPNLEREIFKAGQSSEIASRVGIHLVALIFPLDPEERRDDVDRSNHLAATIHRDCDPTTEGWGWAPDYWQTNSIGNVMVVRKDRKPLSPKLLEILCIWCHDELGELFAIANERCWLMKEEHAATSQITATRQKVLDQITSNNFRIYQKKYLEDERSVDDEMNE